MINASDSNGTFYILNQNQGTPIIFIHDAPFDNEIIIAIGGASSGRAHARTGDRYQDMKEMGIEPK
jgi:hypothetical protein